MRLLRILLVPLRVVALLLLLLAGLVVAGLVFPRLAQPARNRIIGCWSRWLLRVCSARVRTTGEPLPAALSTTGMLPGGGRLLLINHVSWIDVYAINAALPSRFVAKSEIGSWPLLGRLVTLTGTLYIERGRRHAVHATNQRVRERLLAGETVAVFPEGTTTDGSELLPFHANLIAPALEVDCVVWPVALRYTEDGRFTTAAAFIGEMGLLTSLWNVMVSRDMVIEVAFLRAVPRVDATGAALTRHHVAQAARERIAQHLGVAVSRPPAAPPADTAAERSSAAASGSR